MSEKSDQRLKDYLVTFQTQPGEKILDQWTFYPNGQGSKTVVTTASGIMIDAAGEDDEQDNEPRMAMLVEGV
eukprot:CAMPEP_0117070952 /NCGR_PEP_ID=MMETSP0472-20121206/49856_1 /TAXON_ID=693140 ORGANISM="Tiarina fusus, Strain LIS" /NCGR_SAMPLE_ID=MMETSP0472 /ASSEMBLY_ACC=CAM_ASM_000603 /LENGTH=71 /DNA_ID=CAMNT_0004794283 /DNA_START=1 /DNA_END=212 /DNA_ORIENTATION=-